MIDDPSQENRSYSGPVGNPQTKIGAVLRSESISIGQDGRDVQPLQGLKLDDIHIDMHKMLETGSPIIRLVKEWGLETHLSEEDDEGQRGGDGCNKAKRPYPHISGAFRDVKALL